MTNTNPHAEPGENKLLPFMAKVGIGKNISKNLTRDEAKEAMTCLLRGEFHPVTFGAFFMALRYKTETPEELAGFLDAMRDAQDEAARNAFGLPCPPAPTGLMACAGAYNGKARTLNVSLAAGLVTAAAGIPVIFHGTPGVPTKYGMTISHILESLRFNTRLPLPRVMECLHRTGIAYADQAEINPAFHHLLPWRKQLGKRSILNTLEILSTPFGAPYLVTGFFHDPYAELMASALAASASPPKGAAIVKGIEGSDELRPGGVYYVSVTGNQFERHALNSDELGLPHHISELSGKGETIHDQASLSIAALTRLLDEPRMESDFRNSTLLNAGLRLLTAQKVADISGGISLAREILNSGAAGELLRRWREAAT